MPTPESTLVHDILTILGSRPGVRLFRNSSGMFRLSNGNTIRTGLCIGAADIIGWKEQYLPEKITAIEGLPPEAQGASLHLHHVARFVAIECKSPRGRLTEAQANFLKAVKEAGGIAGVARSLTDAEELLR